MKFLLLLPRSLVSVSLANSQNHSLTLPMLFRVTAFFCHRRSPIHMHAFRQYQVPRRSSCIVGSICFYSTLTANIRSRRGSKVAVNLPLFIDSETPRPFIDPSIPWDRSLYPEDPGAVSTCSPHTMSSSICEIRS